MSPERSSLTEPKEPATVELTSGPIQRAEQARAAQLLARIGRTPTIELSDLPGLPPGTRLFGKLETVNPGGSIKDRSVARILRGALAEGRVGDRERPGRRLLDSSSGNAGIAYAMLGAALGVEVTLVVPANASRERLDRIRAHGAELILTDPLDGYDFAVKTARRLAAEQPERFWYADQYSNQNNWRAHFESTGPELARDVQAQAQAPIDLFVSGVGTGGTLTGVGRALRALTPAVALGTLVPDLFPGIEGLKPLGAPGDITPAILDESLIDHRVPVRLEEAIPLCQALARRGLFVGPSSGANLYVAIELARQHGYRTVATLLCDTGERYGSTGLWAEGL
jgi:cysteine synthase B